MSDSQTRCPFCQQANLCEVSTAESCWCFQARVPQALRDLLPEKSRLKACICFNCIQAFKNDQITFVKKVSSSPS